MNKKYIYIFTNTHSKDIVKIGKTDKYPEIRAEQLNKQTGTIGKYEVAWFKEVPDNDIAEKIVHYALKEINLEKEYFDMDATIAIEICDKITSDFFQTIENQKMRIKENLNKRIKGLEELLEDDGNHNDNFLIKQKIDKLKKRLLKSTPPSV